MIPNLESALINQVKCSQADVENKLYAAFKKSESPQDREEIYCKLQVLESITFELINSIRKNNK